ncbi:hypothetical protein, partial [Helicobacter ailurogastricus]
MKLLKSCSVVLSGCLLASLLGGCGEALTQALNSETPQDNLQKIMQGIRQRQQAAEAQRKEQIKKVREEQEAKRNSPESLFQQGLIQYKNERDPLHLEGAEQSFTEAAEKGS